MKSLIAITAAAMLITPGAALAQAKPSASTSGVAAAKSRPTVDLQVCNSSGRDATVAVSYVPPGEGRFINRGWFDVAAGACSNLVTTDNANFYFYADATDGSGRRWQGDHTLCVEYPGPYTFYSTDDAECASTQELRGFVPATATEPGIYTWTLDP